MNERSGLDQKNPDLSGFINDAYDNIFKKNILKGIIQYKFLSKYGIIKYHFFYNRL